jgi:hypothetical protein
MDINQGYRVQSCRVREAGTSQEKCLATGEVVGAEWWCVKSKSGGTRGRPPLFLFPSCRRPPPELLLGITGAATAITWCVIIICVSGIQNSYNHTLYPYPIILPLSSTSRTPRPRLEREHRFSHKHARGRELYTICGGELRE